MPNFLPIPRNVVVGFSGGVDSVAAALICIKSRRNVQLAFVHHRTEYCDPALEFCKEFASRHKVELLVHHISDNVPSQSLEEFYRDERYKFFHSLDKPVITAHHLDDCVETYLWSCLNGNAKVIPYTRNNVCRPFLTCKKEYLRQGVLHHKESWYEDPSNENRRFTRNKIRHDLMPHVLNINPGIHKVVSRIVMKRFQEQTLEGTK